MVGRCDHYTAATGRPAAAYVGVLKIIIVGLTVGGSDRPTTNPGSQQRRVQRRFLRLATATNAPRVRVGRLPRRRRIRVLDLMAAEAGG